MVRESWTDERLDDFRAETAHRFGEVDRRFDKVDRRFDQVDRKIDGLRAETKEEIRELRGAVLAFHRLVLQVGGGMVVMMALGFLGVIVTQI